MTIFEKVQRAQDGDKEQMYALILQFSPLITKYARKLNIEDGNSIMTLAFIETVKTINLSRLREPNDGIVVNYWQHPFATHT